MCLVLLGSQMSLGFVWLVGHNKGFEDIAVGLWEILTGIFTNVVLSR